MRVNLVPESARHLEMTRTRQMRVDTRDLAEAHPAGVSAKQRRSALIFVSGLQNLKKRYALTFS